MGIIDFMIYNNIKYKCFNILIDWREIIKEDYG